MDYNIPFRGLKEGKHQYKYSIDKAFFDAFPEGDVQSGDLSVKVGLIKRPTGLETEFQIEGSVEVTCDRCLDEFSLPIEYTGKLFFEFGEETEEVTDELVMLAGNENHLNLGQYIFEFVNLSLPLQKFHSNNEDGSSQCNKEMLKRLNSVSKDDDEIDDPRWDKLRDLIN